MRILAEIQAANGLLPGSRLVPPHPGAIKETVIGAVLHELETTHAQLGGQLTAIESAKAPAGAS